MIHDLPADVAAATQLHPRRDRVRTVRELANARHHLAELRHETEQRIVSIRREAELELVEARRIASECYSAALSAGWSATELRSMGLTPPAKKPAEYS